MIHHVTLTTPVDNSRIAMFAKDTKVFKQIDSAEDVAVLQTDLDHLVSC